jgi:aminoglycoside 6'-N-acetyltransferase-1b/aminoglycoside 6'-N-acetyltransferase-2
VTAGQSLDFVFHPLAEVDLPLLCEWLNRPHLQQWWRRGEITLSEVKDKYLPRVMGDDDARPFLAYLDDRPIGYIQYYLVAEGSEDYWPDIPGPGVVGTDQFLADGNHLNQGLGTAMLRMFVGLLMQDLEVTEIRVDPLRDNLRAINCYRKVGFQPRVEFTTPDGPSLLMIFNQYGVDKLK